MLTAGATQGAARQTIAHFDARKVSVLLCALRLIALAHTQSPRQLWHVAPQAGEARALVRISARRVKIAFFPACAVIPKWRLVAARPLACGSPA
ncbi:hypothetical protein NKI50_23185 [Mesorhizobium sp. M0563]|uniref:hypothetical protein n=1 Tax=unclassified Mesorhizobium TaxID=325217 RepID=UPI00333711F0